MKLRRSESGMTLIEMMIAIVISMILSVAVMAVMSSFEGRRRTLGSASDLDQQGSLAMFQVDRWIRSAGTGLVQGNGYTYGCQLFATKSGIGQLLPLTGALPAPFAAFAENFLAPTVYRLAPVVIVSGGTTPAISGQPSDVLVVMSSGNDGSQVPTPLSAVPSATALPLANTTEFSPGDLLLIADQQFKSTGGPADCLVSQADVTTTPNGVSPSLPLGGAYYAASVSTRSITAFTANAVAIDLGGVSSIGASLPASLQVVGVGDNNTLVSYDLLGLTSPALQVQSQAEGVFEVHAIYGIDAGGNANNQISQWVDATPASAYSADKLTDGSAGASQLLKNIRAVRVAIIMRTALPERTTPTGLPTTGTPDNLAYFSDVPGYAPKSRPMSSAEKNYRYRVVETTIPVRNNQY